MARWQVSDLPEKRWPALMSLVTVAEYCDLAGASTQQAAKKRAERFCKSCGITVLDIPGAKGKKVRRKDIDACLNLTQDQIHGN